MSSSRDINDTRIDPLAKASKRRTLRSGPTVFPGVVIFPRFFLFSPAASEIADLRTKSPGFKTERTDFIIAHDG